LNGDAFLVLSLPRSRSAWISRYLSYRGWHCGHDQLRYMRSVDDIKAWLAQPETGSCETAGAPFWRLLPIYAPGIRLVTVRRPVEEVVASLMNAGLRADVADVRRAMITLDRKLDQIEGRLPNVLRFNFDDLKEEAACRYLFEYCLPFLHDSDWWQQMAAQNIQINLPAMVRYVRANTKALQTLSSQARHLMMRDLNSEKIKGGEIVIREETLAELERDGKEMFMRHCVEVGESAENWETKNIPLMHELNRAGQYQVMVGRCNGKVFGYLATLVTPTLESRTAVVAEHRMFYAAEEFPGLGLKLQRAAIRQLRARGVREVFMRAGVRGSGRRLGTLYRRLGAEEFGEVYRLDLEA
jgi:GNAT superfamily N-acetyltransferase